MPINYLNDSDFNSLCNGEYQLQSSFLLIESPHASLHIDFQDNSHNAIGFNSFMQVDSCDRVTDLEVKGCHWYDEDGEYPLTYEQEIKLTELLKELL